MKKDEIFENGIRKYLCMGYSELNNPVYEINPEYEKTKKAQTSANPVYDCNLCVAQKYRFCEFIRGSNQCNNVHLMIKLYREQITQLKKKDKPEYRNIYNDGFNAAIEEILEMLK